MTRPREQQDLLDFLKPYSIQPSQLIALLKCIEAPDSLQEFGTVAYNLQYILPFLLQTSPRQFHSDDLSSWINICTIIVQNRAELNATIPQFYLAGRKRPKTGIIQEYPLYYSLWPPPASEVTASFFYHLQAHVVSAVNQFKSTEFTSKKEGFADIRRKLSNILRNHLVGDLYHQLYNILPPPPLTTQELNSTIANILTSRTEDEITPTLNDFSRLLDFALGQRVERSHKLRHPLLGNSEKKIVHLQYEDPDAEIPKPSSTTIRSLSVSKKVIANAALRGEALDEFIDETVCWYSSEPLQSKKGESYSLNNLKTKTKHRYIAAGNQMLPHQWDRLNLYEIVHLTWICHTLSQGGLKGIEISGIVQKQLAALLAIMYWISKPLHIAKQTQYHRKGVSLLSRTYPQNVILHILAQNANWVIPLPQLESRRKMCKNEAPYLRKTAKKVILPMSTLPYRFIMPCAVRAPRYKNNPDNFIFPQRGPKLDNLLREVLSKYNAKLNTRLTIFRITNHFKSYLSDELNDHTESAVCLGEYPPTGQQASIYYAAPKMRYLQTKYYKACQKIENFIFAKAGGNWENFWDIKIPPAPSDSVKHVGSQTCLLTKTTKLLVQDLINNIKNLRQKKRHTPKSLFQFHNAFTSYCVVFLKFVSGYRDVADPLFSITDFYPKHELLVISDKDDRYRSKSRVVYLPKLFSDQLTEYSAHCLHLILHLTIINPQLAQAIQTQTSQSPTFKTPTNSPQIPFFFFLNENNGKQQRVTPGTLKKQIQWSYELPANANRHFLRTRLRELGVPGEIVDAYMGHWEYGQEPFGKFSTLSPSSFKKMISPAIDKICKEVGWKTIHGISQR